MDVAAMTRLRQEATPGRSPLRIIEGGLGALPNDADLVSRMAEDLRRNGMPATEREAVRVLMALPYAWQAVARLAAEALFKARLQAAREAMAQR